MTMNSELFTSFNSNMPWLETRTAFLTRHGSHAYGTNLPESDHDYKGFVIPPKEYFLGFHKVFAQGETNTPNDLVVYDVRKFINLAADCNPSVIEVLWTDPVDWIIITANGERLIEHKHLFISKKARWTFSGYAVSQLQKINRHYKYLKNPPKAPPTRAECGLPEQCIVPKDQLSAAEAAIRKEMDSWSPDLTGLDDAERIKIMNHFYSTLTRIGATVKLSMEDAQWRAAANLIGYDSNFLELLARERDYKNKHKEWAAYQEWKAKRNPARAAIEEKYGYDCKHAMHLVRLMRMCKEILTSGAVIVKRPDRDELLGIRNGSWTYEALIEWAAQQENDIETAYKTSTLPREPDRKSLDQLCISIVQDSIT